MSVFFGVEHHVWWFQGETNRGGPKTQRPPGHRWASRLAASLIDAILQQTRAGNGCLFVQETMFLVAQKEIEREATNNKNGGGPLLETHSNGWWDA